MKKIIALLILIFSFFVLINSCQNKEAQTTQNNTLASPKKESIVYVEKPIVIFDLALQSKYDSLLKENTKINLLNDSLKKENKKQKDELFLANFTIEKVETYAKICNRKPSQKVFLLGWINRTIKVHNTNKPK